MVLLPDPLRPRMKFIFPGLISMDNDFKAGTDGFDGYAKVTCVEVELLEVEGRRQAVTGLSGSGCQHTFLNSNFPTTSSGLWSPSMRCSRRDPLSVNAFPAAFPLIRVRM